MDKKESVPLPSVPSTWFAEPSAPGNVNVTFELTLLGDFNATKFEPYFWVGDFCLPLP